MNNEPPLDAEGAAAPQASSNSTPLFSDTSPYVSPEDAIQQLNAQLAAQIAAQNDQYLRSQADMENVRRRAQEEVKKVQKFAIESFAESLLPVHDNLQRALQVETNNPEALREGVEMTLKQLESAFAKFRLQAVLPQPGDKLDPQLHQAVSTVASADYASGCIVQVMQSGYSLAERLLRPALVLVSSGVATSESVT